MLSKKSLISLWSASSTVIHTTNRWTCPTQVMFFPIVRWPNMHTTSQMMPKCCPRQKYRSSSFLHEMLHLRLTCFPPALLANSLKCSHHLMSAVSVTPRDSVSWVALKQNSPCSSAIVSRFEAWANRWLSFSVSGRFYLMVQLTTIRKFSAEFVLFISCSPFTLSAKIKLGCDIIAIKSLMNGQKSEALKVRLFENFVGYFTPNSASINCLNTKHFAT